MSTLRKKKISNKQPNFPLKEPEKEEQSKPTVRRRKAITKIRVKINEIETKMTDFVKCTLQGSNSLLFLKSFNMHEEQHYTN